MERSVKPPRSLLPSTTSLSAALLLSGALLAAPAQAVEVLEERIATDHHDLRLERIASGLEHPWAMAMLPDGRYLVSERPGRLALIDEDGEITHLDGVPEVNAHGQGGLLDVVLHPQYGDGDHDWIYFTWSQAGDGGTATTLSRARLDGEALAEVEELFVQSRYSGPGRHYGSRLAWLSDGTLLMSIGDRGSEPPRAQHGSDHAGSILRLTETGGVPGDNPFVDDDETLDELYTLGNRNPQGLTVAADGTIWSTEHGPLTGDELNLIEPGENYGWPEVSRGVDYATRAPIGEDSLPGMRDPVHVFEGRFAPSGLAEVTGDAFPVWQGDLLAGGLLSERLIRLDLEEGAVTGSEVILDGRIGRIRDVRQGHDGYLYLLEDDPRGGLYRLVPAD
ncbi:PQQ-dependent sugar dehydrogenase [Halomonas heilongjiangensis]|uniref:Glucose sorbosone dehydrogenase n=1 Tax=Halomonas heilongjiangensis TaxID=1387883 RepID=A0A2N7TU35_9GAMM|nr:PQQ-dependent sugar dehydrogenase [Halomonas heilongjiangensis]PMR71693.1 glucose sorbosone dehydrogenase [Halomonas heilongjiangensis]PXX89433.1 glucose sorbosone dehydrogenase [Halomonas heilongjiangensis]